MSKPMIVAGVMSGTSADGINVALVRIADSRPSAGRKKAQGRHSIRLIGQSEYRYPPKVRGAVLEAMNATRASVADLARIDSLLGLLYADAVLATQRRFRTKVDLVGCHFLDARRRDQLGAAVRPSVREVQTREAQDVVDGRDQRAARWSEAPGEQEAAGGDMAASVGCGFSLR